MPLKLLVVEDDPDGAASVRDAAIDGGFEVLVATTGEAGVAAFREQRPALVLTDLVLPDIDGIEVMRRIQQLDRRVPVIMMTAYGTVDSSVRALRAGATLPGGKKRACQPGMLPRSASCQSAS